MTGAVYPLAWWRRALRALSPGPRRPPAPPIRRKPKPTTYQRALLVHLVNARPTSALEE
jgi:hypothetical protein